MKHTRVVFILALLIAAASGAAAETVIDAGKAVELAFKNNLSLQRTKLTADAKRRASDRSWNSLIPSVTSSASTTRSGAASAWTSALGATASVSLSPALISEMDQARAEYESGLISYETAKRSLELKTRKAFYNLLLYKAQILLAEQNVATAQSQYDQTKALSRVGQASKLEELSAQVDLENLKPTLENARKSYEDAIDSFKQILGVPFAENIALEGSLEEAEKIASIGNPARNGESTDVTSLRASLQVAEAQKKASADAVLAPILSVSYSALPTYAHETWTDGSSFTASVALKLDGYLPWSSVRETLDGYDDQIASYKSQIEEAKTSAEAAIRQLSRTVRNSIESIRVLKLNVELAEKSYAMYEESFKKGTSDLQSLKTSGDSLLQARVKVREQSYTLLAALLDLENALNLPFATIGRN